MNIVRIHHRSRKRILIADVLSMIVIGPFAYGIASLGQFQGPAMWIAVILFVSNIGLFGWNTWTVARQHRDFVCLKSLGRNRVIGSVLCLRLNMPRIFLINVGANSSHRSNARCPLFPDGSFVFVPFPFDDGCEGRWPYPANAWPFTNNLRWHQTHVDPDWPQLTYGDGFVNPRAAALKSADPNDILLFWSLLWDNTGDSWFDFTDRQSWHLIGALRIEEILWPGQRPSDANAKNRQRAEYNAHFNGGNARLEPGNVVFIGDTNHSAVFDFAVPLVTQLDHKSLLYRTFRTASGDPLPLNGKHWSGYTRSCRAICDTTDKDGRRRAILLRNAIAKRNDFDLLADL